MLLLLGAAACLYALIQAFPAPLFPHHVALGRLSLYADRRFDPAAGRAVLADIQQRLDSSPLADHGRHTIFVTNSNWRRKLFFGRSGATGLSRYPLTRNVFIRRADIGRGVVFNAANVPAVPPRTLAYYAAHEIAHSFTAQRLGPARLWNRRLPQWVREGYADYVGMGAKVDLDDLYRRYRAGDPDLDFVKSHTYARFRLLTAYMLQRRHWSEDALLASELSQADAEAMMNADMAASREFMEPAAPAQARDQPTPPTGDRPRAADLH